MSTSECKVCGETCIAGFLCVVRVGSTWIKWRECPRCYFAFERECSAQKEQR